MLTNEEVQQAVEEANELGNDYDADLLGRIGTTYRCVEDEDVKELLEEMFNYIRQSE